jgi:hypothetical protein
MNALLVVKNVYIVASDLMVILYMPIFQTRRDKLYMRIIFLSVVL